MAHNITPVLNPAGLTPPIPILFVQTCRHKLCAGCETRWNVCCDCRFSDRKYLMAWNEGTETPIFYRGAIKERYCSNCYEHWNTRLGTTNDYPRVLEVPLSHPDIPAAQPQGRISMPPSTLSRSARRRIRRITTHTTGRNLATCWIPLAEEGAPTEAASGGSTRIDSPATSSVTVGLSGGVSLTGESILEIFPVIGFPNRVFPDDDAMEVLFRRFVVSRRSEVRSERGIPETFHHSTYNVNIWGIPSIGIQRTAPQAGGPAEVSALEQTWALAPLPNTGTDTDSWDTDQLLLSAIPNRADLVETARHTARLLDAFTHAVSPPIPGDITPVQQRLLTTAVTSTLAIARAYRVHAAVQSDVMLSLVDDALRPDAACVVCYGRVVDMVLMPCSHLVLCEGCCVEIKARAGRQAMRCPVCRVVVRKTTKVFRG